MHVHKLCSMCHASFLVVSIMINVTLNLSNVCILLKSLHIAQYVHNLVYSRVYFTGIITAFIIVNTNILILNVVIQKVRNQSKIYITLLELHYSKRVN